MDLKKTDGYLGQTSKIPKHSTSGWPKHERRRIYISTFAFFLGQPVAFPLGFDAPVLSIRN